jgi:predicted dehydrogenase
VFDIGDAENAYRVVLTQPVTAVLFSYGTEVGGFRRVYETPTAARRSGKIKVAIVGCGSFATTYHLPNLRRIDDYDIVAIIDHDPLKSKRLANQYGAKYYGSDYHELLDKTDIDLFLITTRHGSHAQITIDAADSKKDVFVEKPMALNQDELDKVVKAVTDNGIHYSVGFNRRFSPLALRAKEILSKLGGATMINCMINAGKLPGDYWVYDPKEGGGRIIGECCHFFDLFNFLIDSEAVSALGTSVLSNLPQFKSEDNIVATLKYRDGSIANLVYDSIGSNERPKERIEVLKAGRTLIIDDFRELAAYGCIGSLKLSRQDKGHYEELVQFARVIKGESASTISLEECARATRTTYEIAQMITGQKS